MHMSPSWRRVGPKVPTVPGTAPRQTDFDQTLCVDVDGIAMDAAVRSHTDDGHALEQPRRFITRTVLAYERVQCNSIRQVELKMP